MIMPAGRNLMKLVLFYLVLGVFAGWRYLALEHKILIPGPAAPIVQETSRPHDGGQNLFEKKKVAVLDRYRNIFGIQVVPEKIKQEKDTAPSVPAGSATTTAPETLADLARLLKVKGITITAEGAVFLKLPKDMQGPVSPSGRERPEKLKQGDRIGDYLVKKIDADGLHIEDKDGREIFLKIFDRR